MRTIFTIGTLLFGCCFWVPIRGLCAAETFLLEPTQSEMDAVRAKVEEAKGKLGGKMGVPEKPDSYTAIPKNGHWITPEEAKPIFLKGLSKIRRNIWWKIGIDPTATEHTLREPGSFISACAAAARGGLDGAEEGLVMARDAADFLIWAQSEAGSGVFPFPATHNVSGSNAFKAFEHSFRKAEREGRTGAMIHKGWVVDDSGDGGLQFDNAEAGVALVELYEVTKVERYLTSAIQAADWAVRQPVCENWNYNSFSVYFLAKLFAVNHERSYLLAAVRKALLGVIPGQLTDGPRVGRWIDPHNARPEYHYIMMRALAQLAVVMPVDDPNRTKILQALVLGLKARNSDFLGLGAPTKNKALEALLIAVRGLKSDPGLFKESLSEEALDALGRLLSEQFRKGAEPLAPRESGLFLEYVLNR